MLTLIESVINEFVKDKYPKYMVLTNDEKCLKIVRPNSKHSISYIAFIRFDTSKITIPIPGVSQSSPTMTWSYTGQSLLSDIEYAIGAFERSKRHPEYCRPDKGPK